MTNRCLREKVQAQALPVTGGTAQQLGLVESDGAEHHPGLAESGVTGHHQGLAEDGAEHHPGHAESGVIEHHPGLAEDDTEHHPGLADSDGTEHHPGLAESGDTEEDSDGDTIVTEPQPGTLYFILGDCVEGYYLVKCLSSSEDSFRGRYLTKSPGVVQDTTVEFQESSKCDTFYKESILSEVLVSTEILVKKKTGFSIDKAEFSDILATVGELSDY